MPKPLSYRCNMKPTFTTEDADRLLQLADQFLTDWEETAHEGRDPEDIEEVWQRRREWKAIRPILAAATAMLDALDGCIEQMEQCERLLPDDREFISALTAARAARAKAGAT